MSENQLIVAQGKNHPALYHDAIELKKFIPFRIRFPSSV
jgi:tRNA-specific 2-thiouridylase